MLLERPLPAKKVVKVIAIDDLPILAEKFQKYTGPVGIDLETTGLKAWKHKIVTMQFGTVTHQYVLDCRPFYNEGSSQDYWKQTIHSFLKACNLLVFHNGKFDLKFLMYHFGTHVVNVVDTMLQELVLYGVGLKRVEVDGIAVNMLETAERYGLSVQKDLQKWSVGLDSKPEWYLPLPADFIAYCSQDVYIPLLIYTQQQVLLGEKGLLQAAAIENACMPAVAKMELDGMYIDRPKWAAIVARKKIEREALGKDLQDIFTPYYDQYRYAVYAEQQQAFSAWTAAKEAVLQKLQLTFETEAVTIGRKRKVLVGSDYLSWGDYKNRGLALFKAEVPKPMKPEEPTGPINLGSSQQLQTALAAMGILVDHTDKERLAPYASTVPAIATLLHWKNLDKFLSAFGDSLLEKIEDDGRLHADYGQNNTATGRMTCSNPNLQQLPSHFASEDDNVRACVVGEGDNVILTADFDNIEYRILTDISKDPALLDFFAKGGDLHSNTARLMFNLPEDVNPKKLELKPGLTYRSVAKTINYGLVYGMSPVKLAKTLGVSLERATELFELYFTAYAGVKAWLDEASEKTLQLGYSETLSGRKRFFTILPQPTYDRNTMSWETYRERSREYYTYNSACARRGKNAPIQGSNADITKYALALLYKHLPSYVKIVAAVHDEIVLEVPAEKAAAVSKLLATAMYKACKKFLHTVYIPPTEVTIKKYWQKS